ncbi:MAG: Sec-independent protein translocase protein TatB [Parvularcula sp.]|jgi:sec-independent protein translocase protein TatB|nr:Sec-independent protein translocase protein TatB [Parvularcula sp.]
MSIVPQLGLPELMVLAILALLVIGPQDLPKFLYNAGKLLRKARKLADEFRGGIRQMVREAEMEEMRREIEELKRNSGAKDMSDAMADIESAAHQAPSDPPKDQKPSSTQSHG